MNLGSSQSSRVRFGPFELDNASGELRKAGIPLKLQPQPFRVLSLLVDRAGEVVSREEIQHALWDGNTFVDFDRSINFCVNQIRAALSDGAENPRYVETLPRRGYRFIGVLEKPDSDAVLPRVPKKPLRGIASPRWVWVGAAVLVLFFAGAGWWRVRRRAERLPPPAEVVPLVAVQGNESWPSFSPDGNQVAFTESGEQQTAGIYVTGIDGERSLRLTDNPRDCCPTWSPDSRKIAFVRYSQSAEEMSFYGVSALGGIEHRLYTGQGNIRSDGGRLDWSPDGRFIAFSEPKDRGIWSRITLLSLSDLSTRSLTSPLDQEYDVEPAFSPDGASVAFARGSSGGNRRDLFVIPVSGGEPKRLTSGHSGASPTWTQDGKEIVFSSDLGGLPNLWRVSAFGGTPHPVAGVGGVAILPSTSRKGNQLAYLHQVTNDAIWRINLKDERHALGPPARVFSSRGMNRRPGFSPDGKKVVFESDRLGYMDIWYCDTGGTDCVQVTSMRGTAGAARWSPDGHAIAFEFQSQGYYQIYVVEVPGGRPRLLPTFPNADNGAPTWSRDGQWIYFYSHHEKGPIQLWKVPFKGGSPVQVANNGGIHGVESEDGRFLYYSKIEQPGLWMVPLSGGEEKRILDQPPGYDWHSWEVVPTGIYYLNLREIQRPDIEFFDFTTGKSTPIVRLKCATGYRGLAVSPDGRSIIYVQNESDDSYIMLVKNFH